MVFTAPAYDPVKIKSEIRMVRKKLYHSSTDLFSNEKMENTNIWSSIHMTVCYLKIRYMSISEDAN